MSTALTFLLLISTLLATFIQRSKSSSVVSSYSVVAWLFFLYLALPASLIVILNEGAYIWIPEYGTGDWIATTSLICLFSLLIFLSSYLYKGGSTKQGNEVVLKKQIQRNPKRVAYALLVIGLAIKIYVYLSSGNAETNLARLSAGVRENLGIEAISSALVALRYLSGVADAAATWLMISALKSQRKQIPALLIFLFVISFTFIGSGKRLFLLWPLLAIAIGYSCYVKKISRSAIPAGIGIITILGFMSLLFRIYAPALIASVEIDLDNVFWAQGSLLRFYFFSLEFASFETISLIIDQSDRIVELFGGSASAFYITNVEPLLYFIPRAFWPGKPESFFDLSHAYRVFVFGGSLEEGGGIASTLLGTAWTIAKLPGLIISMIVLGRTCRLIDNRQPSNSHSSINQVIWYSFALVAVFHAFRQGTIGWTIIIVCFQQSGLLLGFTLLQWAGRPRHSNSTNTQ